MVWQLLLPSPLKETSQENGKLEKVNLTFICVQQNETKKSDKIKASILLTCTGERGREIYETFDFANAADKLKLDPILQKFERYCNTRSNTIIMRHKFFTSRQSEGVRH